MYLTFLVEVIALCYMKTDHCDSKWKDGDQLAKIHELKWYHLKYRYVSPVPCGEVSHILSQKKKIVS